MTYPHPEGGPPIGPPPPPQFSYVSPPATNALAIVALVTVFMFLPLGIIFGHLARGQIKRTGEHGRGLATAALVIGYSPLIIFAAIFVVYAILVACGAR